jgi:Mrp family chromosome partitioning ATPase
MKVGFVMATKEEVLKALKEVKVPGVGRNLEQMNLIKEVKVKSKIIDIKLANAALNEENQKILGDSTLEALEKLPGKQKVNIEFVAVEPKEINQIGKVIAIMSGKGGVGKSLVTGLTANALKRKGYSVGILDADITGPSIPKMFGVSGRPLGSSNGIMPVVTATGIEIISINLLLSEEGDAVIWRGPLIAKAITQFWEDVNWGKLDYLLVDLPPGTADAPLTVMQSLPLNGAIVVLTPQDLTAMIVKKAISMAKKLEKPILGIVENMSYLYVPEIDKKLEIFGKSSADQLAMEAGAPLLGRIPIDPELAKLCDAGDVESYNSEAYEGYAAELIKIVE